MSTTKKPTGIIYRAYNTISGKSYIGQTVRPIERRIKEHFSNAFKATHKFANALISYEKEVWEWSVLKTVPTNDLDTYEMFFIDDLDTYNTGYNTLNGNHWSKRKRESSSYERRKIELYHKDYGVFSGYKFEILQLEPKLYSQLYKLLNKKALHRLGWVLVANKERYDEIIGIYEFYHPDVGVVKCTTGELDKKYIYPTLSESQRKKQWASSLIRPYKPHNYCHGWILLKNKEEFESRKFTLYHEVHGQHTLFRKDYIKEFGLTYCGLTGLLKKKFKEHKGWKLKEDI